MNIFVVFLSAVKKKRVKFDHTMNWNNNNNQWLQITTWTRHITLSTIIMRKVLLATPESFNKVVINCLTLGTVTIVYFM